MKQVEIIQGDALTELAKLPSESVDAIITDPPYASGGFTETGKTQAKTMLREHIIADDWFQGDNLTTAGISWLLRSMVWVGLPALKKSGHILIFSDWRMVPFLVPVIESAGVRYQSLLVWDKKHAGLGTGFRPQHELIMHFTTGTPVYQTKRVSNVLTVSRVTKKRHPTEKPVALLAELMRVTVPPGGLVVDPFAGSGTTGVAALSHGFRAVLIERSAGFCKTAEARMREELQQGLAFDYDGVQEGVNSV